MNKKMKTVLVTVLIVIGIAGLALGIWLIVKPRQTNKDLFSESLKKSVQNIKELGNTSAEENSTALQKFKLTTDSLVTYQNLEEEGTYHLSGDLYANQSDGYLNLNLLQNEDTIFDLEAVVQESKVYYYLKDVFSKFYYVDLGEESLDIDTSTVDFSVLYDYFVDAVLDHVDDEKLVKEEKTLTLGEKEFDVDKLTANFTAKDSLEIVKAVLTKVKGNKELATLFNEFLRSSSASSDIELEMNLDTLLEQLDSFIETADDKDTLLSYAICLNDKDVLSNEIGLSMKANDADIKIKFVINTYQNKYNRDSLEAYVSLMGLKVFTLKMDEVSDTKVELSMGVFNTVDITGSIIKNSDEYVTMSLTGSADVMQEDGTTKKEDMFTFTADIKEVEKDKEYDADFKMTFGKDDVQFDLTSSNKVVVVEEIPEVDLSDSAPIEDMTEKEKEAIAELFGGMSALPTPVL